jgi:putative endonuclease
MDESRRNLGQRAENLVADRLCEAGYTILDRNWRYGQDGELDLVAQYGATVIFVEVRARRGLLQEAVDSALESISATKRARLIRLAEAYLSAHDLQDRAWRITVVAVAFEGDTVAVEIIKDAVEW